MNGWGYYFLEESEIWKCRWKEIDEGKDDVNYFLSEFVWWKYFCLQEEKRQPMAKFG